MYAQIKHICTQTGRRSGTQEQSHQELRVSTVATLQVRGSCEEDPRVHDCDQFMSMQSIEIRLIFYAIVWSVQVASARHKIGEQSVAQSTVQHLYLKIGQHSVAHSTVPTLRGSGMQQVSTGKSSIVELP